MSLPSKFIQILRQTDDSPPSRGLQIDGFAEFMELMSDNVISKGSHCTVSEKDLIVDLITRICTQQEELSHATALAMGELRHAANPGHELRACLRNSLASTLFEPEWGCLGGLSRGLQSLTGSPGEGNAATGRRGM